MNSYTSFIELLSAFNFAFIASQSLSKLFFEKINTLIESIQHQKVNLEDKMNVLKDNFEDNNWFHVYKIFNKIALTFVDMDSINKDIENIENKLKRIFLLSGLYGVALLFYAGQEDYHKCIPLTEIFMLGLGFIVLDIKNYFFHFSSILTNIFNFIVIFTVSFVVGHYNSFEWLELYSRDIIDISLILLLSGFVVSFLSFGFKRFGVVVILNIYKFLFKKLNNTFGEFI